MISYEFPWNLVGIGNHLFIYSYTRLLAEHLDYQLFSTPVDFIEKQGHKSLSYQFKNKIDGINNQGNEKYHINDEFTYQHGNVDNVIDFFSGRQNHIVSCGYYQKYSYWKNHKNTVKNYFNDFVSNEKRSETDIAIHLRNSYEDHRYKLDEKYYLNSLERFQNGKVFVFADNFTRHSELLEKLNRYDVVLMDLNVPDSIREITKFNNIICSQGSFSFWVSFLSSANKIIWPIPKIGPNKLKDWSLDYVVDDEDRYNFVYL